MTEFSRRQLTAELKRRLEDLGYGRVAGKVTADALFYKWIDDTLVLTLGIEFSARYTNKFTASYFLAPSFEWAYLLRDYSERAYLRVGEMLTQDERLRLLDPFYSQPEVIDAWWIGFTPGSVASFVETVQLTEPRFLGQQDLREEIAASREMREHIALVIETQRLAGQPDFQPNGLHHQPKRYTPPVEPAYYWAAEEVLRGEEADLVSARYTDLLARDAWRLEHLRNASGLPIGASED